MPSFYDMNPQQTECRGTISQHKKNPVHMVSDIMRENSLVTKPGLRGLWANYDHLGWNKGQCIPVHQIVTEF